MYSPIKKQSLLAILSIAFSSFTYSADIARTLRTNAEETSAPENFLEVALGVSAGIGSSFKTSDAKYKGIGLGLSGSYNWQGFFIDAFGESSDPLVIGYNAYNSEHWSFDAIFTRTGPGLQENDDNPRLTGINRRENNSMLGARLTGYFGENIVQFSIKHDISDKSNGTVASASIGRNWQVRNWNFHGLVGLTLVDARYNDYFLGVSEEEAARLNLETFDGEAAVLFNSSVGATYPISENWVFRTTAYLGSNFGSNDSPLFKKRRAFSTGIGLSISYVF